MTAPPPARRCASCGTELAPALLACPACHALVHAERLEALAARAERLAASKDPGAAIPVWREALALLPEGTEQRTAITERITALEAGPAAPRKADEPPKTGWRRWLSAAGAVLLLALSKLKLLLLGLTKLKTVGSMLLFVLVYVQRFGWPFAAGFTLSIYVHEMGHVAALAHFGIPASAPMFIPGFGAFVRLNAHPPTAAADARVGLAGPIWGVAAALLCWLAAEVTGQPILRALAHAGAWINLFNLLPVWQLDGGRGVTALARPERVALFLALVAAFGFVRDPLFVIVGAGTAWQCFRPAPETGDRAVLATFIGLIGTIALLLARTGGAA
jgi:Zn-dependent protease